MYIDLEAKGGNPNGPMDWDGVGGKCVSLRGRQVSEVCGRVSDATEVRSDEGRLENNMRWLGCHWWPFHNQHEERDWEKISNVLFLKRNSWNPDLFFSTQSGGTILSKKMAFGLLICHFLLYPFNMEMKFQFLGFPWWCLWKFLSCHPGRRRENKEIMSGGQYQIDSISWPKMISWWDPRPSHVAVTILGASSGGCFDIAIVMRITKRVRFRNENRQGFQRSSWKCQIQKPWRNMFKKP